MDGYEYSMPQTTGGAAGSYTLNNPWSAPIAEAIVVTCSFTAAGSLTISPDARATPIAGTTSLNADGGGVNAIHFIAAAAGMQPVASCFFFVPNRYLTVIATGAGNAFVTVIWRRPMTVSLGFPDIPVMQDDPEEEAYYAAKAAQAGVRQ